MAHYEKKKRLFLRTERTEKLNHHLVRQTNFDGLGVEQLSSLSVLAVHVSARARKARKRAAVVGVRRRPGELAEFTRGVQGKQRAPAAEASIAASCRTAYAVAAGASGT